MLEITVIARQGLAEQGPTSTRFGADGGTIGRADTNRLVLDDPDRTVSRLHAQVVCRDGLYAIIDRGSNPMQLNGQSLGNGSEAPLNLGDRLIIGGFELVVSQLDAGGEGTAGSPPLHPIQTGESPGAWPSSSPPSSDDPFADLLDGLVPTPSAAPKAAPAPSTDEGFFPDPLGLNSSAGSTASDPFADLLGSGSNSGSGIGSPGESAPRSNDFSDLISPSRHATADSIDAMFGLGTPSGSDPLAMTPLADSWLQPNTASAQDPLAALSQQAPQRPPARSDHVPVGQFGFVPPQNSPLPSNLAAAEPGGLDPFAGLSNQPPPAAPVPIAPPLANIRSAPISPPLSPPLRQEPATGSSVQALPLDQVAGQELLAAFLRGLGPLQQSPTQLTPGLMERVGEMLRTATEGTLQLLQARQELKREVRAQATMIAAQANNPLKFSPTVEVALAHLLGPGMRGFMPAEAAMRDAYQDLRAHEFGVMVGTRAALAHVIERFEPSALEKNITARSKLDAIFASNRKAKLWDQFVALYGSIATEAEDDFHNLFGKAFLKAYEEQMERLKSHEADAAP